MSVLIKGMEMPENCNKCWALDDFGDYPRCRITDEQRGYNFNIFEKRMDKCPLVEVPKHGRLIDADEFEKYVELEYETREISHPNWIKFRVWCGDQPTIIEAEE